jgi:hypothetical protein
MKYGGQPHYLLADLMDRYREKMENICAGLSSADFYVCAVGSTNKIIEYWYDPPRPHYVTCEETNSNGWVKTQVPGRTLDELAFGTFLGSTFAGAVVKLMSMVLK